MDIPGIIIGAAIAGQSAVGAPAPIVDQAIDVVEQHAPVLEQIPDPQPYIDDAIAAVEDVQNQLPPQVQTEIEHTVVPEIQEFTGHLPLPAREVVPPAYLPPTPAPAPVPTPAPRPAPAPPTKLHTGHVPLPPADIISTPWSPSALQPGPAAIPSLGNATALFAELTFDPHSPRNIELAKAVVRQAFAFLGLPYQWGGGTLTGPSLGDGTGGPFPGFDCSAFVRAAYYLATGGEVALPRTSQEQFRAAQRIPIEAAQPGDLLFGNWQSDGANHVAMYLGDGKMIEAPQTGQLIQVSTVRSDMVAARVM